MTEIEAKLTEITENYEPPEQELIRRAFEFSKEAHEGQDRKSGDPYITHPLETALIVSRLKLDANAIAAALLHDISEETHITPQIIEKQFGPEIAYLVRAMTKLAEVRLKGSHEPNYIENLRKMFIAAAQDLRVAIIRLADRLHNMRTLQYIDPTKQESYARETLEIFAPLANRLGIGEIKGQLEDLAFPYVYPDEYLELKEKIEEAYQERKVYVDRCIKIFEKLLKENGVKVVDMHGRVKHIYSLYKKMQRKNIDDPAGIADLVAVRIVVPETADCYLVLGLIHDKFRPKLGQIKDYISVPKPNGYQSLHTDIFGPEGKVVEVQIRTPEMHEYAEHGIAAHWAYHEADKPKTGKFAAGRKAGWVKQLRDLQKGLGDDPKEFMQTLKLDIFENRIFCFTPIGDVIDLPLGATPIDFAYAVHSDLGERCQGSKINNKIAKLTTPLQNGDVVEILVSKNPVKASRDWLQFVKTSRAREKIRQRLKS